MKIVFAYVVGLFVSVLLSAPGQASVQSNQSPLMDLRVSEGGIVSASLTLMPPSSSMSTSGQYGVFYIVLPFPVEPEHVFVSAPDVAVRQVCCGPKYSIAAVFCRRTPDLIPLRIEKIISLSETREAKAKLEIDLSYQYMSQRDKEIAQMPSVISQWDVQVGLPREYDPTELSYEPNTLKRVAKQTFFIAYKNVKASKDQRLWIVFPNPMQSGLLVAEMVVFLLLGALTTLFHWSAVKNRNLAWVVGVLLLSTCVVGVTAFYAFSLAKRLEFLAGTAVSLPHAVVCFGASVYLLVSRVRERVVTGLVERGGARLVTAHVQVCRIVDGKLTEVTTVSSLNEGRYRIHVRVPKEGATYRVVAEAEGAHQKSSSDFQLLRNAKQEHEVELLNLELLPIKQTVVQSTESSAVAQSG